MTKQERDMILKIYEQAAYKSDAWFKMKILHLPIDSSPTIKEVKEYCESFQNRKNDTCFGTDECKFLEELAICEHWGQAGFCPPCSWDIDKITEAIRCKKD